jgi:membrane protease subunit HflC
VRASDGSNFWFESLEIQYRLIPERAAGVIDDSGPGDGFKREWIRGYARSVLRDEFGRISAVEVANPSSYEAAALRSTERMNDILREHGIQIMRLITPKPRFDKDYESAIEEKKVADQKVDHLKVKEEQLLQQREQQLAQVAKEKEIEWQELQGELRKELLNSEKEAIFITKGADRYKVTREAQGQQERDKHIAEARGLVAKYTAEAEGIRAQTEALEKKGRVVVREALIQKLATIRFTLVPYSRDPAPSRLEHQGSASTATMSGTQAGGGL